MASYRLQCSWAADTAFARDRLVINPVFELEGNFPDDVDQLCEDLATALKGWDVVETELTVKGYEVGATPPNEPLGSAIRETGSIAMSTVPREVALCLSFYAESNQPRRRGRLFLPAPVFTGQVDGRPTTAHLAKIALLPPIFAELGGINVDWVVYSQSDSTARKVTNWWVDNEWDTIRSRGMRPTTRTVGTTSG